jgi:hypothetical protein
MNVRLTGIALLFLGSILLVGCGTGDKGAGNKSKNGGDEKGSGGAANADKGKGGSNPDGQNQPKLKPAAELKIPPGLDEPPTESKMPASAWKDWGKSRVGDWVEMELTAGLGTSRNEVFDVADHAVLYVMDVTVKIGDMTTKTKSALKFLFTEPDKTPEEQKPNDFKTETKKDSKTFQVGTQQVTANTLIEVYEKGKLLSKTWTSEQVPLGGIVYSEDAQGKALSKLTGFGKGK